MKPGASFFILVIILALTAFGILSGNGLFQLLASISLFTLFPAAALNLIRPGIKLTPGTKEEWEVVQPLLKRGALNWVCAGPFVLFVISEAPQIMMFGFGIIMSGLINALIFGHILNKSDF